uniref:Uncharacterized protein n=1 Tax=Anguilla anguilla TaxID=7936 RepID=A0A0E9VDC9_ANGAN
MPLLNLTAVTSQSLPAVTSQRLTAVTSQSDEGSTHRM